MSEKVQICDLLKDEHFLLKVITAIANFYGTRQFLQYGRLKSMNQMIGMTLALPACFLTMCHLLYLYRIGKKDSDVESIMLTQYIIVDTYAWYITWLKAKPYITCPGTIFTIINCLLLNITIALACMTLDLVLSLME